MIIHFKPCFAYDVLCYGEQRHFEFDEHMFRQQKSLIEEANRLLRETGYVEKKYLSMPTLSLILSIFTNNEEILEFKLSDLISVFSSTHRLTKVIKRRIGTGDFRSEYVLPMLEWLNNGYAQLYVDFFDKLGKIDFYELWKTSSLPMVERACKTMQTMMTDIDVSGVLQDLALMKGIAPIDEVTVYKSFFSHPVSFCLHNNSYLDSIGTCEAKHYILIIIHELMHGFSDSRLTERYRDLVKNDDFLKATHNILTVKYQSGDEAEFTVAAEYYICFKNGLFTYDELLDKAMERYSGCMPLSILLFDLLCKEDRFPKNYNKWLHHIFDQELLVAGSIKHSVDRLLPSYSEFFNHHKA